MERYCLSIHALPPYLGGMLFFKALCARFRRLLASPQTVPPPKEPPLHWKRGCWGLWPGSGYVIFESDKTPEQLKADLRATLGPSWDVFTPGFKGWVVGPCVRVGWVPKWYNLRQRSHLAFRGWLVKAGDGSGGCSLRGHIRMHALLEWYLAYLYLLLLSICVLKVSLRSLIAFPVGCLIITWLTGVGAQATIAQIHAHLTAVCAKDGDALPRATEGTDHSSGSPESF